jgi:hypothetical protein
MANYHAFLIARGQAPNLVEFALASMTILYGGLLGIFALGIGTRGRGSPASVIAGLAAGSTMGLALFLHPLITGHTWIAWPWWIPISSILALGIAATRPSYQLFAGPKPDYSSADSNR